MIDSRIKNFINSKEKLISDDHELFCGGPRLGLGSRTEVRRAEEEEGVREEGEEALAGAAAAASSLTCAPAPRGLVPGARVAPHDLSTRRCLQQSDLNNKHSAVTVLKIRLIRLSQKRCLC